MRQLPTDGMPRVQAPALRAAVSGVRLPVWLLALILWGIALLPRCTTLADFFTIDEAYHWIGRVDRFAAAIRNADWAATNQTGHPGVTVMWLGAGGRWLASLAGVHNPGWAGGGALYLAALRLPIAVVNSLAVAAGYLVLRRLLPPGIALLAGLLWATSPFLIAHGRLLHLDALLTSCMTLSVLLLLVALRTGRRTDGRLPGGAALIGSGVCAGLALLTKAPSLSLLPFASLLMLLFTSGGVWSRLRGALVKYSIWLFFAVLVVLIAWPALWVAPIASLQAVAREIVHNGGALHHSGNYFLGQPVGDPGPLFYPAVVLWRTTPFTLIGLLLLPLALRRPPGTAPRRWSGAQCVLLALLGWVVLYGGAMSLEPKKFDRYLLPIWPSLEILAAAGLLAGARWIATIAHQRIQNRAQNTHTAAASIPGALFSVLLMANLAWYHPYYLGYFNPLPGGGTTAQRVMLVGWGEGMEQIGAWLRERPDLKRGPVLSWIPPTLAPFIPASTLVLDLREQFLAQPSSYAVLYARSVQRKESATAEAYVRQTPPLFTLRVHGIEYASVHQLPRPYTEPVGAVFGAGLHLRGFSQQRSGTTLVITPSWDIQADQPGGRFCFVHVLAPDGRRVAQVDAPLDQGMFAHWQAGQQFDSPLPVALPATLRPGEYRVVLGVYDPARSARLRVSQGHALPEGVDGPDVIHLTTLRLP